MADSQSTHSVPEGDRRPSNGGENVIRKISQSSSHMQSEHDLEKARPTSPTTLATTADDEDPNIVFWEGPDDPENPMNWPHTRKIITVIIVSTWTLLSPLASSMVAPGIRNILTDFDVTSNTLGSFVVSIYLLGNTFGPLIVAPLSEVYGRLPVYHVYNVVFVIWTLACALAPDFASLLVFRFFQGTFGVCALTIGAGTISDLIAAEQRGKYMSVYTLGPLLGPVIGPIGGAYLVQAEGWRWVFRALTIASGFMTILTFVLLHETYAPALLQQKAKRLRKEFGNARLRSKLDNNLSPREIFTRAIVRPTKMLLFSPIVFLLSLYLAVVYGYLYLLYTTITPLFQEVYGFSQGAAGLSFLGIGIGMLLGLLVFGSTSDRVVTYLADRAGGDKERKPEYRFPHTILGGVTIPIGLFWYGWSAQAGVHYVMPIVGTGFLGFGVLEIFMPVSTYLVDAFTIYAASATAANTILRSLLGAFLPLAGPSMYDTLGLGWGNSLLGFIAIAMWPVPILFFMHGERIRKSERFKVEF